MKEHVCREATGCHCYMRHMDDYEPHDDCPEHGTPWPPRCCECGKLLPWSIRQSEHPTTHPNAGESE